MIGHKCKALQGVVDRCGAYIGHLSALVPDLSVNGSDRARLNGYIKKWSQAKILVGTAMYEDVPKSPSLLSLSLQENDLYVVMGIKHALKSIKALKNAAQQNPSEWPTLKLLCKKIVQGKMYQGATLRSSTRRLYSAVNSRH